MPKLTKQFIDCEIQAPAQGQQFYRDSELPGFAVRVTRNCKSYVLERRIGGNNRRITIAKCSELSLEAARIQAYIMLGDIERGSDPKTGKRINTLGDITLREVLQKFLEIKPIRETTQRNYHFAINRHFNDWLDIPLASITKDMVEERHKHLTVSPNRLGTSGHGRANNALKKLSALINFANDRFGTDDEPLIKTNPVSRLSRNRSWHRNYPRRGIIADSKLKIWYQSVLTLKNEVARDFLIFLLFTGMRFGETRKLKWSYVDFKDRMLIVPRELTKTNREHRLPLSDFLVELLRKRFIFRNGSEWVFQSARLRGKHLSEGVGIVRRVRAKSDIHFTYHDLRRTFLTMGEKLDLPPYALKQLVNHSVANDMTGRYLVLDEERLRQHMTRITNAFLERLDINGDGMMREWKPAKEPVPVEITQLQIPIIDFHPV